MALTAGACVASTFLHVSGPRSIRQLLIHRFPRNGDHDYDKTCKTSSRLRIAGDRDSASGLPYVLEKNPGPSTRGTSHTGQPPTGLRFPLGGLGK